MAVHTGYYILDDEINIISMHIVETYLRSILAETFQGVSIIIFMASIIFERFNF